MDLQWTWAVNKVHQVAEGYESECCDHFSLPLPGVCRLACSCKCQRMWKWFIAGFLPSSLLKSIHGKRQRDNRLPAEQTESEGSVPAIALYCWGVAVLGVCKCPLLFSFWSASFLTCIPASIHATAAGLCKTLGRESFSGSPGGSVIFHPRCREPCLSVWVWLIASLAEQFVTQQGRSLVKAGAHTHTHRLSKDWLGSTEWGERGWYFRPHPKLRNGRVCL